MKALKIFISSTREDLKRYRPGIIDKIKQMDLEGLAMEFFGASPREATEVCFEKIDDCDVFVGIYGFRYGYIPGGEGKSITEQEYDYARKRGKPCLCYFANDSLLSESPPEDDENKLSTCGETEEQQGKLSAFKNRIDKELVRWVFDSPGNLIERVAEDIEIISRGEPIGLVYTDVVKRWVNWEISVKNRICEWEFNNQPSHLEYNSPLTSYWQEFVKAEGWHDRLRKAAKEIMDYRGPAQKGPSFLSLTRDLESIDWNKNYIDILVKLKSSSLEKFDEKSLEYDAGGDKIKFDSSSIIKLGELKKQLKTLKLEMENPSFGKCFLVLGRIGAGKTHFIASFMSRSDKDIFEKCCLILKLDPFSNKKSLEDIILDKINGDREESPGGEKRFRWRSLEQINTFLEKAEPIKPKLVVVIDDLEKWISVRKEEKEKEDFPDKLIRSISSLTHLHSFYWLVTLDHTSYDSLSTGDVNKMFSTYSWHGPVDYHRNSKPKPLQAAGWFDLDEMNISQRFGLHIIRNEIQADPGEEVEMALEYISEDEPTVRKVSEPFIAWTLLELRHELPLETIVRLNYIAFVERFWEKRVSKLCNGEEKKLLKQAAIFIAQYFADTGDLYPFLKKLKKHITAYAEDKSELGQRDKLDYFTAMLIKGNFIRKNERKEGNNEFAIVEVQNESFWEKLLAEQLLISEGISNRQFDTARIDLETWFAKVKSEEIKEGVFEFILLMLTDELKDHPSVRLFCKKIWRLAFHSDFFPAAAVWFAASRAPVYIQKTLIEWVKQNRYLPGERRELFSYLHFLHAASPEAVDVISRLSLVHKNVTPIARFEFNHYYSYLVGRIISRITDNGLLVSCMHLFRGSEILGTGGELAKLCRFQLFSNIGVVDTGDDEEIKEEYYDMALKYIIKYLTIENEYAEYDYEKRQKEREKKHNQKEKWVRYFFHEFVLFEFIYFLVRGLGPVGSFYFLEQREWFRPKEFGFERQVALEMEREATIGIGQGYRAASDFHDDDMAKLITGLLASDHFGDRKLAFHIIRHTVHADKETAKEVNPQLHPFVKRIYNDPYMKEVVDDFPGFFRKNLNLK
jgi:hypothetical protein